MYYGLTKFYQNHQKYIKSRDDQQLIGSATTKVKAECEPYDYVYNGTEKLVYAPAGAIANSLFNDTLSLDYHGQNSQKNSTVSVGLLKKGIAWSSDANTKFANPQSWSGTARPKNWQKNVYELDPDDPTNNGYRNQDLIVWMRTAALPSFRKFYRRVEHSGIFERGLPAGFYSLQVEYSIFITK